MNESRISRFPASSLRLCIDQKVSGGRISGRIVGVCLKEEIGFQDLAQLSLSIEKALNEIGQPQASYLFRSFRKQGESVPAPYVGNPKRWHEDEEISREHGKIRTIDAVFTSRQHGTWQGVMKEPDGRMIGRFVSDLRFMEMLEGGV